LWESQDYSRVIRRKEQEKRQTLGRAVERGVGDRGRGRCLGRKSWGRKIETKVVSSGADSSNKTTKKVPTLDRP